MAKKIIIDTGFWIGFFEERDPHHKKALLISEQLHLYEWVIPWPSLYETLNTRFVRRKNWLISFEKMINKENTVQLSDDKYKETIMRSLFIQTKSHEKFSLVDLVIREMLLDVNVNINAITTFNSRDFQDICCKRNIEILGD
ncbi:MAG: hypothetical protein CR991_10980 [Proteobacteria bacterium]|nr:MAG: hypothetical protein CR991_10980 [Pseudomonadota bacterium]